LFQLLS